MIRKIITIDDEKCNGCGLCSKACHENAIGIENGKAVLLRDDYCDGLGDCLPVCPMDAIHFVEREALEYDREAVEMNMRAKSQLNQWPIQIKLVPTTADYFDGSELLVASDCSAYAYADFHDKFMNGRAVVVGCPKLDDVDYSEKLADILRSNAVKKVVVTRMEVPCCSKLANAVVKAVNESGKELPVEIVTVGINGEIINY
ncbi:MAG: 4Fe-4S binding protein [Clostridioides sp.]|nr:4Fe-4S binding protein [Clostridioides sp.]